MTAAESERRYRKSMVKTLSAVPADGEPLKWWQKLPGPSPAPRNPADYEELMSRLERSIARLPVLAEEWAQLDTEWHEVFLDPSRRCRAGDCAWGKKSLEDEAERLRNFIRYARHHLERYARLLAQGEACRSRDMAVNRPPLSYVEWT